MKKHVLRILRLITVFALVIMLPMQSFAVVSDEIQLASEDGAIALTAAEDETSTAKRRVTVTLSSAYAAVDGVTSLQFSLDVDKGVDPKFVFNRDITDKAKIAEYRYDSATGQMNIYVSGTEQLFSTTGDPLKVGYVSLVSSSATVSVVPNSLKYVYGTELKETNNTGDSENRGPDYIDSVEHQHVFDEPAADAWTWTETEEGVTCTVEAKCTECGDLLTFDCVVSEDQEKSKAPTCTESGETVYIAAVELNAKNEGHKTWTNPETKAVAVPATGVHDYSYTDNKDGETHTKKCKNGGEIVVNEKHTLDEHGVCTLCQGEHTHSYGSNPKPAFKWAGTDENPTCEAIFTCTECNVSMAVECKVEEKKVAPTCTEPGKTVYVATAYGNESKPYCSSDYDSDKVVLTGEPAKGHTYGEPEMRWSEDNSACTAVFTCAVCKEEHSEPMNVAANRTEPTCVQDGFTVYSAYLLYQGKEYQDSKTVTDQPATGKHDYMASFTWMIALADIAGEEPLVDCNVALECRVCGHRVEDLECEVQAGEMIQAPTCTESGIRKYTAAASYEGKDYTDEHEVVVSAANHERKYSDNKDGRTHTVTCANCDAVITDEPHNFIEDNCICGAEKPKEEHVHTYGEPVFQWAGTDETPTCTAVFTCTSCAEQEEGHTYTKECIVALTNEVPATCTEKGSLLYTATVTFNRTYRDEKAVSTEALGHDYSICVVTWSDDKKSAAAQVKCVNCLDVQEADCEVTEKTIQEATCTERGVVEYTATVRYQGKECGQETQKVETPAAGHTYGEAEFVWDTTGEKPACTAVFTCTKCGEEQQSVECSVISEIVQAATCTEPGMMLYTATASFQGEVYPKSGTKTVEIPAVGHSFTNYVSNNDATCLKDGTKTAACDNGCGKTDTVTDEGSRKPHERQYKDSQDGSTHIVTCKNCSFTAKEPHVYDDGVCICGAEEPREHTHTYGEPAFEWSEDYSACKAVFTCTADDCVKDGNETYTADCDVDGGKVVREPTCQKAGEKVYTAAAEFHGTHTDTKTVEIPVVDHKFTEYQSDNNATCTEDGTKTAKCDYGCGETDTVTDQGSKKDHSYTKYTNHNDGKTHTAQCENCGHEKKEAHSYNEEGLCVCGEKKDPEHTCVYGEPEFVWDDDFNCAAVFTCTDKNCGAQKEVPCTVTRETVPASCDETGELIFTAVAELDGKKYTDAKVIVLAPVGHSFKYSGKKNEQTHTLQCERCDAAQEEAHIYQNGKCTVCGAEEHVHSYKEPVFTWADDNTCTATFTCVDGDDERTVTCEVTSATTEPTCTEAGETVYTAVATLDDQTYTDSKKIQIEPTGHAPEVIPGVEPTCTSNGLTEGSKCSVCGEILKEQEEIPAVGHTLSYTDNQDGTHTAACSACDYSEVEVHDYQNGKCVLCGAEKPEEPDDPDHTHTYIASFQWSDDNATCKATFTCKDCGDSHTVNAEVSVEETPATCTENGQKVYTASASYGDTTASTVGKTEVIPAVGHSYVDTVVPPTETEQGYTEHTCSVCGDTYRDAYTDPTPSVPSKPVTPAKPNWLKWLEKWFGGGNKPSEPEEPDQSVEPDEPEQPSKPSKPSIWDWIWGFWK